jgi:hypothetical protein
MTSAASALVLVGWDDVKGRPIYSKKNTAAAASSSTAASAKKNEVPTNKKTGSIIRKSKTKIRRNNANVMNTRRNFAVVSGALIGTDLSLLNNSSAPPPPGTAADADEVREQQQNYDTQSFTLSNHEQKDQNKK